MRIEIIGAGAVGLLLASFYAEKGVSVRLITKEKMQKGNVQINRTNVDGSMSRFQVECASTVRTNTDLIIVAVKYGQLPAVYKQLASIQPAIPLLFVQNGVAHFEEAMQLSQQHIAFSSIQFGAQKLSSYHVAHKGIGVMKLAVAKGDSSIFAKLQSFSYELLPVHWGLYFFQLHRNSPLLSNKIYSYYIFFFHFIRYERIVKRKCLFLSFNPPSRK